MVIGVDECKIFHVKKYQKKNVFNGYLCVTVKLEFPSSFTIENGFFIFIFQLSYVFCYLVFVNGTF